MACSAPVRAENYRTRKQDLNFVTVFWIVLYSTTINLSCPATSLLRSALVKRKIPGTFDNGYWKILIEIYVWHNNFYFHHSYRRSATENVKSKLSINFLQPIIFSQKNSTETEVESAKLLIDQQRLEEGGGRRGSVSFLEVDETQERARERRRLSCNNLNLQTCDYSHLK